MKRALENVATVATAIAIPAGLLWLVGYAFGALQEAPFWQAWPEDVVAAFWLVATLGGLAAILYVIRQLLSFASARR